MQETWVQSLFQEDPTCLGTTKPVHRNYWACVPEPGRCNSWSPSALELVLHKRSPATRSLHTQLESSPRLPQLEKNLRSNDDPAQQIIMIINFKTLFKKVATPAFLSFPSRCKKKVLFSLPQKLAPFYVAYQVRCLLNCNLTYTLGGSASSQSPGKERTKMNLNKNAILNVSVPSKFVLCACLVASVTINSVWSQGLPPCRLLCSWDSPGKNTGVSC